MSNPPVDIHCFWLISIICWISIFLSLNLSHSSSLRFFVANEIRQIAPHTQSLIWITNSLNLIPPCNLITTPYSNTMQNYIQSSTRIAFMGHHGKDLSVRCPIISRYLFLIWRPLFLSVISGSWRQRFR